MCTLQNGYEKNCMDIFAARIAAVAFAYKRIVVFLPWTSRRVPAGHLYFGASYRHSARYSLCTSNI